MALNTVRDLLRRALLVSGAMNVGEDPDDDEFNDALDTFQGMLGIWETQRLILPYVASVDFLTVAGQDAYTVGPGGDVDFARPNNIRYAWYETSGFTRPIQQLQFDQYGDIPVKSTPSNLPWAFMYNASFPLGYFVLYPVPTDELKIILAFDAVFVKPTLDQDITTFPSGYVHAWTYNLAALLPAEYNKEPKATVVAEAKSSKGALKSTNLKSMDAVIDVSTPGMLRRGFNYITGDSI